MNQRKRQSIFRTSFQSKRHCLFLSLKSEEKTTTTMIMLRGSKVKIIFNTVLFKKLKQE